MSQAPLPLPGSPRVGGQSRRPHCCPGFRAARAQGCVHCFPDASVSSVTLGLASRAPHSLFPHPAPSAFQSTHLQMYRWVDLSSILVGCLEKSLPSYRCFTCCRLNWGDKGSFSRHHNTEISPALVFIDGRNF